MKNDALEPKQVGV